MADVEYSLHKKQCFVQIEYEHLAKMQAFYKVPEDTSPTKLIAWMCEDFLPDVKLSAAVKKKIAEEIKKNTERRERRRQEWAGSEASQKYAARRKRRREEKKMEQEKKGGK